MRLSISFRAARCRIGHTPSARCRPRSSPLAGPGFLESIYENALAIELTSRQVPFVRQAPLSVTYKGMLVGRARVDFIVAESVVVELKAVENFAPIHTAQGISYLKASGLRLALLINFNVQRLENGLKRVILG